MLHPTSRKDNISNQKHDPPIAKRNITFLRLDNMELHHPLEPIPATTQGPILCSLNFGARVQRTLYEVNFQEIGRAFPR